MNLAALWLAIKTKADADNAAAGIGTAAAGRIITGFYYGAAPESALFPFVLYNVAASTAEDAFTIDVDKLIVRFAIYVGRTPPSSAGITDPTARLAAIEDRIYAVYNRASITVSAASTTTLLRLDCIENHTEDYFCVIPQYKLWMSK